MILLSAVLCHNLIRPTNRKIFEKCLQYHFSIAAGQSKGEIDFTMILFVATPVVFDAHNDATTTRLEADVNGDFDLQHHENGAWRDGVRKY